jgi:hypothetical protein
MFRSDPDAVARIVAAYNANCYHQTCDEFDARWTFAGTEQEATVAFLLGYDLANRGAWPSWNARNEYKPRRDETEIERRLSSEEN